MSSDTVHLLSKYHRLPMFTIVVQLFDLVKPADCDIPSWRAVAKGRATLCSAASSAHLKCNETLGKQISERQKGGFFPKVPKVLWRSWGLLHR